jgi:uncharacterized membrane protein YebE (DUF533 family)
MAGMVGSGSGYTHHKKHKGGGLKESLVSSLSSGKGLMTVIGLGVGAYEILKSKQGAPPPLAPSGSAAAAVMPPVATPNWGNQPSATRVASFTGSPVAPPPIPRGDVSLPVQNQGQSASVSGDADLAIRMIQVMIAAAHADGGLDRDEEEKILTRLQGQGIGQEEKEFILAEIHDPKSIEQLASGIIDPRVAQAMYGLAVSAIVVDTEEERAWLDKLAAALSLSPTMCRFIED